MKFNFKEAGKHTLMTVAEIGTVGGSMILTKKFLDFNTVFKRQIEADPKYAEKFHIKHQGAIKLVGGALGASMVKNPWIKLALVGVALEGFITEARTLMTDDKGTAYFDAIGAANEDIDQEMLAAAQLTNGMGMNPADAYPTGVSGGYMGAESVDLSNPGTTYVSGMGMNPASAYPTGVSGGYMGYGEDDYNN